MDFTTYQNLAERTARQSGDPKSRFANFGMGIAGEAGEVCDLLKKVAFHGHELDKDKLKKELGDVLWYVATLSTTAELSLKEVAEANVEKLRKRYPEGFDEVRSQNREEYKRVSECSACAYEFNSPKCEVRSLHEVFGEIDSCFKPREGNQ